MPFAKGNKLAVGKGRPKGSDGAVSILVKDAIIRAATEVGDEMQFDIGGKKNDGLVHYLKQQAVQNPGPFLGLIAKVIPLQVNFSESTYNITVNLAEPVHGEDRSYRALEKNNAKPLLIEGRVTNGHAVAAIIDDLDEEDSDV